MTDTKTNEDLREKILAEKGFISDSPIVGGDDWIEGPLHAIKDAMDEYFSTRAKQMLEWMAKNVEDIEPGNRDGEYFYYKGEWITGDALFENFL